MAVDFIDMAAAPANISGEIVERELVLTPRPNPLQSYATSSLADELISPFQKARGGPGGWWILCEPELSLGEATLTPDLGGWRSDAFDRYPRGRFAIAPEWVCEVLCPETRAHDLARKRAIYHDAGVEWFWQVDPDARLLEAFRRSGPGWLLSDTRHDAALVRVEPFAAIEISLAGLWPD